MFEILGHSPYLSWNCMKTCIVCIHWKGLRSTPWDASNEHIQHNVFFCAEIRKILVQPKKILLQSDTPFLPYPLKKSKMWSVKRGILLLQVIINRKKTKKNNNKKNNSNQMNKKKQNKTKQKKQHLIWAISFYGTKLLIWISHWSGAKLILDLSQLMV